MKITGGKFRGKVINPVANQGVRPTTGKAREALFNALGTRISWNDALILDGFTGSGAIALEAVGRGAKNVVALDINLTNVAQLKKIIANWTESEQTKLLVSHADTRIFLKTTTEQFDLIFLDPPYSYLHRPELIKLVGERKLLFPDGILVIEHPMYEQYDKYQNFLEQKSYGYLSFSFFN